MTDGNAGTFNAPPKPGPGRTPHVTRVVLGVGLLLGDRQYLR